MRILNCQNLSLFGWLIAGDSQTIQNHRSPRSLELGHPE